MNEEDSMVTMRPGSGPALGRIDQYDLVRKLGGGGFGVVYLARDTNGGVDVAIKTLHPLLKHSPEEMEALRAKFALVSRLAHPNIATALVLHPVRDVDVWNDDARRELKLSPGDSVMVMRYAPGVTLSKWRRQFPDGIVPPDLALEVGRLLSGEPPFSGAFETGDETIMRSVVLNEAPDPVDGLSPAAGAALFRALAKDPKDRFPTCGEFVAALGGRDGSTSRPPDGRALGGDESYAENAESAEVGEKSHAVFAEDAEFGGASSPSEPPRADSSSVEAEAALLLRKAAEREVKPRAALAEEERLRRQRERDAARNAEFVSREQAGKKSRRRRGIWIGILIGGVIDVFLILYFFAGNTTMTQPAVTVTAGSLRTAELPGGGVMRFRGCPAGSFMMGSPTYEEGRGPDETQHLVTFAKGFWMGETEVTQGQWKEVMDGETVRDLARKAYQDPFHAADAPVTVDEGDVKEESVLRSSYDCGDLDDQTSIYFVSWTDAASFCRRLTEWERRAGRLPAGYEYRLPTEAEWEYACRAGTTTALPNGRDIRIIGENNAPALDDIAWYGGNSSIGFSGTGWDMKWRNEMQFPGRLAAPRHVATKAANEWGLHDMIGNVWEWCSDWYADYPTGPSTNPTGPALGGCRVFRGGCWKNNARFCRSATRDCCEPGFRGNALGFRVVLAPVLER